MVRKFYFDLLFYCSATAKKYSIKSALTLTSFFISLLKKCKSCFMHILIILIYSFFSGGIERNWVGVPRELHKKGKDPRCVCVKNTGPPSNAPDKAEHQNRGDLDHPDLKEYPNCPSNSDSCQVNHP